MDEDRQVRVPFLLAVSAAWGWRFLVVVAAVATAVVLLTRVYVVVVPVLLSLFLASVLEPVVAALRRRRLPPALAAVAVFVASLLVLGLLVRWIGTSVASEFEDLGEEVSRGVGEVKDWLQTGPLQLSAERITELERNLRSSLRPDGGGVAVVRGARRASEAFGGVVLLLFTLFFVLKDGHRMAAWLQQRIPVHQRGDVTELTRRARSVMRQYLIATALTGFVDGVLIGIALLLLGVPLVLPLAVLTFLGGFFPIVGATLAGLVAALVALVDGGPGVALLVVAATVAVQQIEGNLLQPLILERAVNLHPLVTVWAVAAGLVVAGLLGAFLSVPLVAIAVQIGSYYRARRLAAGAA